MRPEDLSQKEDGRGRDEGLRKAGVNNNMNTLSHMTVSTTEHP